jgi:hypothetical protein
MTPLKLIGKGVQHTKSVSQTASNCLASTTKIYGIKPRKVGERVMTNSELDVVEGIGLVLMVLLLCFWLVIDDEDQ